MNEDLHIENYCALFIDLLGQQNALKGEGLLKDFNTEEEEKEFIHRVRNSVGAIDRLQKQAEAFRKPSKGTASIRDSLSDEDKESYDLMGKATAKQQRWSDGLVFYSSLKDKPLNCPMDPVYEIFSIAGALCFQGLAGEQPIRGAIEVSWGVELHQNELYGAVVANSYNLESNVAQYPRIVIGEKTINYLDSFISEEPNDTQKLEIYNRNLAVMCKSMIAIDHDGYHILDYLGPAFTKQVTQSVSKELYQESYKYIQTQYELHQKNQNTKLVMRYVMLRDYFNRYKNIHT
tara:strand:- start:15788 stop:16657 length:870 start_codon:yes stop_codon:yes gene_type:complete